MIFRVVIIRKSENVVKGLDSGVQPLVVEKYAGFSQIQTSETGLSR